MVTAEDLLRSVAQQTAANGSSQQNYGQSQGGASREDYLNRLAGGQFYDYTEQFQSEAWKAAQEAARQRMALQRTVGNAAYQIGPQMTAAQLKQAQNQAEKAKGSVFAFDENGKVSAWQTLLNMARDAKNYVTKRTEVEDAKMTEAEKLAREKRRNPQSAQEAKEAYGLDYELEEAPFWSWLAGRPIYKKAKGVSLAEVHGLDKSASTGDVLRKTVTDTKQNFQYAKERFSTPLQMTGDEEVDNWHERTQESNQAAQLIASTYGIPTYAVDGSMTQQTTDAYLQNYENKSFGQKMLSNAGITAADYGLSLANSGLTIADAVSGGQLSSGIGKAASIYQVANYLQNAGSGLTGTAFSAMRESSNWLGRLVLDLEKTSVEQLFDRAFGEASLIMMGLRVFGSSAQEAENRGESLRKQVVTGGARAAVEVGTELLGGVGGSWRGTGYGDAFFGKLDKWVAEKTGSELIGTLASTFGSEATEEMLADILNPIMDRIFKIGEVTGRGEDRTFMQKVGDFAADVWGDGQLLYDGLLGGLAGALGGASTYANPVGAIVGQPSIVQQAKNLGVDVATYKAAQRISTNNKLKKQFQELTGVELSEDEGFALMQVAVYLTNVTATTEGVQNARQAETNLMSGTVKGTERASAQLAKNLIQGPELTRSIFSDERALGAFELSDAEVEQITAAREESQNFVPYAYGMKEAYEFGQRGMSFKAYSESAALKDGVTEPQAKIAWALGRNAQIGPAKTVDTDTDSGRLMVRASLTGIASKELAEKAAAAYEKTQDVATFATAMEQAVNLYAAAGADLQSLYREAKEGNVTAGRLDYLTPAQITVAAEIGSQVRQDLLGKEQQAASAFRNLQKMAAEINDAAAPELTELNRSIKEMRDYVEERRAALKEITDTVQQAVDAAPAAAQSENVRELSGQAEKINEEIRNTEEMIRQLEQERKKIREQHPGKRKKGTVSYGGGVIDGRRMAGIDPNSLNVNQKKAAALGEVVADALDLDVVFFDGGETYGNALGAWQGDTLYINMTGHITVNGMQRFIVGATMSHELTHYLQKYNPEVYRELKDFVVTTILKTNPETLRRLVQHQMNIAPNLSYEKALDEVVANACQTMLFDSKAVRQLAREKMTAAEKIADSLREIGGRIRAAFDEVNTEEDHSLFAAVKAMKGELNTLQEIWDRGILGAAENYQAAKTVGAAMQAGTQFMKIGTREDGIEVYETSEEVRKLPWKQRKQMFMDLMTNEYRGRTAKFIRNGHAYYAKFAADDLRKNIYGDRHSDQAGIDAKINTGADGAIFDLVENATYRNSSPETGKNTRAHRGVNRWDYFVKTVQIDGRVFDLLANVRRKADGEFVYSLQLTLNDKIKAASPRTRPNQGELTGVPTASNASIADAAREVNMEDPVAAEEAAGIASGTQWSRFVEDEETLKFLDEQERAGKIVKTYKSFLEIDGKLYPPMASMKRGEGGKKKMVKAMEVGRWEESVGDPSKVTVKPGEKYGHLDIFKDNGKPTRVAYNPYQHSSNLMLNDQFSEAYNRPNLVTYECIIPESELTSGYRAQYAKDAVGRLPWKAGKVASQIAKAKGLKRDVYLSRWLKPVRKVPEAEVAQHYKELLDGTDIAVPSNVVPPALLRALEEAGVKIEYTEQAPKTQFMMAGEVEETDRLIAVHNKTYSGLRRMIMRGGVPYPSVAIKKAGDVHNHFGPVSIIFPRRSIDPKVNRRNRIYGGDAWTPTEPRVEYEADYRKLNSIKDRLRKELGNAYYALRVDTRLDTQLVEQSLGQKEGDVFEALKSTDALKYAYMRSIGQEPELPTKVKTLDGFGRYSNKKLLAIFDAISEEEIENATYDNEGFRQKVADVLNRQAVEEAREETDRLRKTVEKTGKFKRALKDQEDKLRYLEKAPLYKTGNVHVGAIQDAFRTWRDDGRKEVQIPDSGELESVLRKNTEIEEDPKYRAWLEELFNGVIVDSGLRNNKDPFTPSGNRRSFQQLHVPATLENTVAIMDQENEKGISAFGVNLIGAGMKDFGSVEEARADVGRLYDGHVDDDVFYGQKEALNDRLHELVRAAAKDERWETTDSTREILLEAVRDSKTKQQMDRKLRKEAQWINYDPALTDELWQLAEDTRNINVPYFEAKMRRVATLDEPLAYIVEDSAETEHADLLKQMRDLGLNVLTYKAGDIEDRRRVINSVEGAQFQQVNDDQVSMDEWTGGDYSRADTRAGWSKEFRGRIRTAEQAQARVREFVSGLNDADFGVLAGLLNEEIAPEGVTREELGERLAEMLSAKAYRTGNEYGAGTIYGAEDVLDILSRFSEQQQVGRKRTRTFELMEALLGSAGNRLRSRYVSEAYSAESPGKGRGTIENGAYRTVNIPGSKGRTEARNADFDKWYRRRHPSLYYPGYVPGDLFTGARKTDEPASMFYARMDAAANNVQKEKDHLHKLLDGDRLLPEDRAEAQEFLNRLNSYRNQREVFCQQADDAHNGWAPVFYSKLRNTVDEWTNPKGRPMPDKMAGNAVIPWLRGKGVKAEEIRWAGLQPWLEGRKSVTKAEVQEFLQGNDLNIETQILDDREKEKLLREGYQRDPIANEEYNTREEFEQAMREAHGDSVTFEETEELPEGEDILAETEGPYYVAKVGSVIVGYSERMDVDPYDLEDNMFPNGARWGDYRLESGENYREILFRMPELDYTNNAMATHWGHTERSGYGIIAHARVQDFEAFETEFGEHAGRMLFVEEIQSDLHNEGAQTGYRTEDTERQYKEAERALREAETLNRRMGDEADRLAEELYARVKASGKKMPGVSADSISDWLIGLEESPIYNPNFFDNDPEVLREGAIAETQIMAMMTADEIELKKKATEARAEMRKAKTKALSLSVKNSSAPPDVPFAGSADTYHEYVMKHLMRMAAEDGYDVVGWTTAKQQEERWSSSYAEGYRIEYDQKLPKFMGKYTKQWGGRVETLGVNPGGRIDGYDEVWGVRITDAMRKDVLEVGQPLFQHADDSYDDTAPEESGREIAYTMYRSQAEILGELFAGTRELTRGAKLSIGEIQKRLNIGKTPEVRTSDARKMAKAFISEYSGTSNVDEVAAKIKAMGDYLVQAADVQPTVILEMAREIAADVVENAQVTDETVTADETILSIAGRIAGSRENPTKFVLDNPEHIHDAGGYESIQEFNRAHLGFKVSVTGSESKAYRQNPAEYTNIDAFYSELQNDYGENYFPQVNNEGEQLEIMSQLLQASRKQETVNPFEAYMGEAVESAAIRLAHDVMMDEVLLPDREALRLDPMTRNERMQARNKELGQKIRELTKEKKLTEKEAGKLYTQIAKLNEKLAKAEEKYQALQERASERVAQVQAEGRARAAERVAKEKARSAKKNRALKEHYQDVQKRAKERREESAGVTKYRAQVTEKANRLYTMLMKNDNKTHVPEVLKAPLAEFLSELDFTSKRALRGGAETRNDQAFAARLQQLQQLLQNQQRYIDGDGSVETDLGGYVDISQDSLDFLRNTAGMITRAMADGRTYTINSMTAAELKQLSNFLSNLYAAIRNMNSFMANARFESVREAAAGDWEHMNRLGRARATAGTALSRFAAWENGTPYYVMKRYGEGGKAIFEGLTKGWEKMAFNAQKIINFTENLYTDREVNRWKKEQHTFTLADGSRITMTTAQIMELNGLVGRQQALQHIQKGGIRIGDIKLKTGEVHDTTHYHLTAMEIREIVGSLTARQAEVAKALQLYMAAEGAKLGNEISMRRFGYNFYTEGESYYPIRTDANDRPMADTDAQTNSMFRLLNLSSSKALNPKASNALIVGDIFDTFSEHMGDMAKLNGMGLPILDAIKWFNYKERVDLEDGTYDTKTIQSAMEQAFGSKALSYFRTLMKDINGVTESGDRGMNLPGKLMSNYKIAAVGANLRVAMLQPTSYLRAMTVLKPQNLIGVLPSVAAYREAMKYSGTAVWKALGYYDTDISKGMRGQIAHADTVKDKLAEASMTLAEKGDQLTWSMLWTACKRQVRARDGKLSHEELMEKTADLFREVVYSSQVMDSTLTRSEIMRGKTTFTKMASAFMAEPTLSYNILLDAVSEYSLDARKNGKAGAWVRNSGKIGKAFTVYVCSAAFSAVVESIADAMRDDDDEEFWEKFRQALWGEDGKWMRGNMAQDMTILGKLPFIKNFISTLQGYSSGDMSVTAFNNLLNVCEIWKETIELSTGKLDKATKVTYYGKMTQWGKVYKTLQALSQLSGLAVSNLTRDVTAIWNTVMNGRKDEWKIRTYDGNALKPEKEAAWKELLEPLGITKNKYQAMLGDADASGNNSVTQDEMGEYLKAEVDAGSLTKQQADAIWKAQGWAESHDYDWWLGGKKSGSSSGSKSGTGSKSGSSGSQANTAVTDYDSFSKAAPLYGGDKKQATYAAKPAGMSLQQYTEMLKRADTDNNGSLKQDELGYVLRDAVQGGRMSWDDAVRVWAAQGWSHDLSWWAAKHP